LTQRFDELIKIITRSNTKTKQLEDKIASYEKRIHDLSEKNSEEYRALSKSEEDQFGANNGFEKLSEHVERLLELTRNSTDLLEYTSEKFSDVSEQNRKLKGIHESGLE
jgi:predicted  nucleic acid-binding Zn-ribbon protein